MRRRTIRDFEASVDVAQIAEGWAQAHRFVLTETASDGTRCYRNEECDVDVDDVAKSGIKRVLFLWLSKRIKTFRLVTLRQDGRHVHLEAWLEFSRQYRAITLYMLPTEMGLEGGGLRQKLERSETRNRVNPLLIGLGQTPIR